MPCFLQIHGISQALAPEMTTFRYIVGGPGISSKACYEIFFIQYRDLRFRIPLQPQLVTW